MLSLYDENAIKGIFVNLGQVGYCQDMGGLPKHLDTLCLAHAIKIIGYVYMSCHKPESTFLTGLRALDSADSSYRLAGFGNDEWFAIHGLIDKRR